MDTVYWRCTIIGLKVRASIGTLALLGLTNIRMDSKPRTAYFLQYYERGCLARCSFCPQSITSNLDKNYLSRIKWPIVDLGEAVQRLVEKKDLFDRACIQGVIKPWFHVELVEIARRLHGTGLPVSVASNIVPRNILVEYHRYSDSFGVGLDAASPKIHRETLRPGTWDGYWRFIEEAVKVYGRGNVYVHLIAGLGESPRELVETITRIYKVGARIALFAFTPVKKTVMAHRRPPAMKYYRFAQVYSYLLGRGYEPGQILEWRNGEPRIRRGPWLNEDLLQALLTSGCPGCNRPYYNEPPGRILYNYPDKRLLAKHRELLWSQLEEILDA